MTLAQLSDAIGVTLANLSILKTGKAKAVRFTKMEAICDVLGCQPCDILAFRSDDWGKGSTGSTNSPSSPGREPGSRFQAGAGQIAQSAIAADYLHSPCCPTKDGIGYRPACTTHDHRATTVRSAAGGTLTAISQP